MLKPGDEGYYGDPQSPVVVQLVQAILMAALRRGAMELRLEWRDHVTALQALLDAQQAPAHPDLIHVADLRDAPPAGGWAVVHVLGGGISQVTLVPPAKLWRVVKHRFLELAGVQGDPSPGWRREVFDGVIQQSLVAGAPGELVLWYEPVPGGEHLVITWG